MITIRNVSKSFGSQHVLHGIDLEIDEGETIAVVGPSGVGKSVLLKLIMGILAPDEGEIIVCGRNITRARNEAERNEIRSKLGVLFQSAALFDSLTVYDNIAFPLKERFKMSRSLVHRKVQAMLESLSLEDCALHFPEEIPLGMRKRVGMARALITEPSVLLFDEPNTGLDPIVGQEVYNLINECKAKWGFTGVVISHEIPEVFQVSDRIAMLLNGRLVEDGEPKALMESKNPSVMQFLSGSTHGPIKIQ
ncbi:MAG: ATP-binding cassette domain-containing protein [SAR324 cluster bacterium]|uniref:ATP-binding cassette domain-containing protein n=1 Tax=SAR324 cluster bacterium TaxID=2024889 RepID=A0A7X9FTQ6_9DELT|nr:ATP-binding cassette domain-containing protein [SAR324 cluster bacterium]